MKSISDEIREILEEHHSIVTDELGERVVAAILNLIDTKVNEAIRERDSVWIKTQEIVRNAQSKENK